MIEWKITSSTLILLILLLRVIVKNQVSPRLRYALWGLALLRLLIPGTLWESRASVMTPVAAQEVYQEIERIPRYVRTLPDGWLEIGHENGWTSIPQERVEAGEPVQYGWPERTEASVEDLQRRVSVRDAFVWTWLAGVAVMGAFLLAVNLKFVRGLKKKRRTAGKYRGRWVFVVDGLATPCLAGLFCPGIYLTPETAADERVREHVLAHEYTHFRQGDHVWAALRGVCLAVHWYDPLVWLAAYLSRRDCELSCDEGAVRLLGEDCRADYGRTLVGLVARRTTPGDLARCATTMTGGKSALKERIALLVKRPRTTAAMVCLVAAACAVFAACTFTGAAEKAEPSEPPQAEAQEPEETLPQPPAAPMSREDLTALPEDLRLLAELPDEDIALCQDPAAGGRCYIRYGKHLQYVEERFDAPWPPEPYFQDLDGDGEKELAVIYHADHGTGEFVYELVVYEWDGEMWTGYRSGAAKAVIDNFNTSRTLALSRDTGTAEVGYLGSTVTVDMNAVYGRQGWPLDAAHSCTLDETVYNYRMHRSGQILLHIYGAVQAEDYPTDEDNILYTCAVAYHKDGTFTVEDEILSTWYPYFALTPAFREILTDYIRERQEAVGGDISADRFAVCDVNGDGRDELITQTNIAPLEEQVERVYDGDGNELLAEYPVVTYYDNGYAKAVWSSSQGMAGTRLLPYTLLKYDADVGKYVRVAAVDGWDKSVRDRFLSDDGTVIPFPDGVDKDGDGFVYYIITGDGGSAPIYGEPVDDAEYARWEARYFGANVVQANKYSLSQENIALIQR